MDTMKTIARPYAKAAFDLALQNKALEQWQEKLTFFSLVAQNTDMKEFFSGPASADNVVEVFSKICKEQMDEQASNLIRLMAKNKRILALPQVEQLFSEFCLAWAKEIEVDVFSIAELSEEQKSSLSAALEKRFSQKVKLKSHIDTSLIGGLKIQAEDMVIDGSLRGKLSRLTHVLQS